MEGVEMMEAEIRATNMEGVEMMEAGMREIDMEGIEMKRKNGEVWISMIFILKYYFELKF